MSTTKLANLINPQVMGDWVTDHLTKSMRFSALCRVDTSLQGRAGDTVLVPRYQYIGDAAQVAEGASLPVAALSAAGEAVKVQKAGNGVELTDEALYGGYGDPLAEAVGQLTLSIAGKVDSDVLAALEGIEEEMTYTAEDVLSADVIADALVKFGERAGEEKVLFIAPEQLATLRKSEGWMKNTDLGAELLVTGAVGMIHGCQVVLSDKIAAQEGVYENYIVMPGAVGLYLKKDTAVETSRDIVRKVTVITADKHYAVCLRDPGRAVKLVCQQKVGGETPSGGQEETQP